MLHSEPPGGDEEGESAAFVSDHDSGFQNYGLFSKENRVRTSKLVRTLFKR